MKTLTKYVGAVAILAMALPASAAVIVDTGVAGSVSPSYDWSLNSSQWLAASFTTPAATITDLLGYINSFNAGSYHVTLYNGGGAIPGTQLFSSAVASSLAGPILQGLTGASWTVAAGTYFVAFEVRPGDTLGGGMFNQALTPLAIHAFTNSGVYNSYNALNLAVRIEGNVGSTVPEPASWAMLIAGFGLTGAALRRRRTLATA